MPLPIFNYTEANLTNPQTAELWLDRAKKSVAGAHAALILNGATAKQDEAVSSLTGEKLPVASAIASNFRLANVALGRTTIMLEQFLQRDTGATLQLQVFPVGEMKPNHWDLVNSRKTYRGLLARLRHSSIARFMPIVIDDKPAMVLIALAWGGDSITPMAGQARRRAPKPNATVAAAPIWSSSKLNSDQLRQAVATFWEYNPQPYLPPVPGGDGQKVKPKHHQLDLRCLVMSARMPLTKTMFGIGDGDLVVKALIHEIKARARSLDLAGTSPLQPAGIETFLSKLPAETQGKLVDLPSIKLLP